MTLIRDARKNPDLTDARWIKVKDGSHHKGAGGVQGAVHILISDGPEADRLQKGIILDEEGASQLVEAICALLGVHVSPDGWERELQ